MLSTPSDEEQGRLTQFFSNSSSELYSETVAATRQISSSELNGRIIWNKRDLPWLKLDISFPYQEMLREAMGLRSLFKAHRSSESQGWKTLVIHGLGYDKIESCEHYGYLNNNDAPYVWTEICNQCPITTGYFKHSFPFIKKYHRIRFMLLEPGGYILPHKDREEHRLGPMTLALNHPRQCLFKIGNYGLVPFTAGSAFALDIGKTHSVWNQSSESRFHIIVHGDYDPSYFELLLKSWQRFHGPSSL